jgi:hypothetical protein
MGVGDANGAGLNRKRIRKHRQQTAAQRNYPSMFHKFV